MKIEEMSSLVERKINFFKFSIANDKNSMEMQKKDVCSVLLVHF